MLYVIYGYRLVMTNCIMRFATCADWLFSTAFDLPASVCSSSTMTCRRPVTNLPPPAERTRLGSPFARAACRRCIRRHRSVRWLARREFWRVMSSPEFREASRCKGQGREDAVADLGIICRSAPASSWTAQLFPSNTRQHNAHFLQVINFSQMINREVMTFQASLGEGYSRSVKVVLNSFRLPKLM